MKKKKTKAWYEQYLNEFHESVESEIVFQNHVYLTNSSRGKSISERKLRRTIDEGKVGTLLRKLDPIAFEVGFSEWKR